MHITYSIENLRAIQKTPLIEIRPVTILVGRNSSGKSTFLRTFPLIRQSINARSSATILWFGELADFGDFKNAVRNNDPKGIISFSFKLQNIRHRPRAFDPYDAFPTRNQLIFRNIHVKYGLSSVSGKTIIATVELLHEDGSVFARIEKEANSDLIKKFEIDGKSVLDKLKPETIRIRSNSLFATMSITKETSSDSNRFIRTRSARGSLALKISTLLKSEIDKRITSENLIVLGHQIIDLENLEPSALGRLAKQTTIKSFGRFLEKLASGKQKNLLAEFMVYKNLYIVLNELEAASDYLTSYFAQSMYLGPARARSERFYRYQELQVAEISPDGQNFPMFLNSLTSAQIRRFSKWIESLFGYGVEVKRTEGHISINIVNEERSTNVTDTGYGVSQILPVLGQIWWTQQSPNISGSAGRRPWQSTARTLAIEQPELHLHPAHQSMLADAFVQSISEYRSNSTNKETALGFIIETHSETLVNRIGELIAGGRISSSDVQIVIFSRDFDGEDQIRISEFDNDGVLTNWPYGFFLRGDS